MRRWLSFLSPMRLYFVLASGLIGLMAYANYTGWRLYSFSSQEVWKAAGPGGHK